jgi:hypothetical protein
MITCYIEYVIDPNKISEFEHYAKLWIPLVNKFGGIHLGYFLPSEGVNNKALALFNFSSLATYEKYRQQSFKDENCIAAFDYAKKTQCIKQYQRSFFRPLSSKVESQGGGSETQYFGCFSIEVYKLSSGNTIVNHTVQIY